MTTNFIQLPASASPDWQSPVATVGDLPTTDQPGSIRLVEGLGQLYWWDGSAWSPMSSSGSITVTDTNSVDLTFAAGDLSATVRLSSNAADSGKILAALNIESTSSLGLRAQVDIATIYGLFSGTAPISLNGFTGAISISQSSGTVDGYLSATDWTTFNSKQDNITAGTTADYYRGDKTMQLLQMSALTAVTDGSAAAAGTIGERQWSVQDYTASNLGAPNAWGYVTYVDLEPGCWVVYATAWVDASGTDCVGAIYAGLSQSPSGGGINQYQITWYSSYGSLLYPACIVVPPLFLDLSLPDTVYLNTNMNYTNTPYPLHSGTISAIRIR